MVEYPRQSTRSASRALRMPVGRAWHLDARCLFCGIRPCAVLHPPPASFRIPRAAMLLWLQNVLLPDELERLRRIAASETFVDGRGTAGKLVSDIKRNEELEPSRKRREELNALFFGAVN